METLRAFFIILQLLTNNTFNMAISYTFTDNNDGSISIEYLNKRITRYKGEVEMYVPNITSNDVFVMRSTNSSFSELKINLLKDNVLGVGSETASRIGESITATDLEDRLRPLFFLEDDESFNSIENAELLFSALVEENTHELNGALAQIITHNKARDIQVTLYNLDGEEFDAHVRQLNENEVSISSNLPLLGTAIVL